MKQFDYRRMSFYQIWIRSFADGNGDGIGDLYGVYDKLEYIRDLGVDGIWFSPIYPSPNADYGYDISDYKNIHPDYGTLKQFRKVLEKAHALGLKVLMDLVINHTSDEHPWFRESCKGMDNPYSDYYIWRDPRWKGETQLPPNNWYSQFEGLAWEYSKERDQYYLHVFAKKQPDLNMDNPRVREEVKSVMRFWLDMGVDGFREDVITFISKHEQLPNGNPFLPAINGLPYYNEGPRLMEYLREFREVALEYGAVQIGESPFTGVHTALRYVEGRNRVLDMMIGFDHMSADCVLVEYVHHPFSLRKLKRALTHWQTGLFGKGWNALYLENHDHPRVISRYGSEKHWKSSGKCLAAAFLFLRGTPFIYQGQELGMTNIALDSIEKYNDVATVNTYHSLSKILGSKKSLRCVQRGSRDNARTPMQWNAEIHAGFSEADPWFYINPNYRTVNAEQEERDPDSILNFYRACLRLRKENEVFIKGGYREYFPKSRRIYMYMRQYRGERVMVVCSFYGKKLKYRFPQGCESDNAELLLSSERAGGICRTLLPYEAQVWKMEPLLKAQNVYNQK